MGKKAKKTRWRALTLNGHQSDSEESSSKSNLQTPNGYENKFSKFTYSSQSTPIRKYQAESNKTTRSNSTTSEHKTTFNEDEYTRITTPRQDVLFKKGYLNKPKNYQTQTSTGTSTTANSTSTCTPDHQSADGTEGTDLEYESPFMFPNGFIDQNGIYYVNSFEPFPFVVYNAPICYPEYPNSRTKRYSTDSMTESVSPQNEENFEQNVDDGNNKTPVFNQTYIQHNGYYYNGVPTATNGHSSSSIEETRRVKKKRRKLSRSKSEHDEDASSEESDDCESSSLVNCTNEHANIAQSTKSTPTNPTLEKNYILLKNKQAQKLDLHEEKLVENNSYVETNGSNAETSSNELNDASSKTEEVTTSSLTSEKTDSDASNTNDAQNLLLQSLLKNNEHNTPEKTSEEAMEENQTQSENSSSTYSLKADAEEFIPRMLRSTETIHFDPNVQFVNLPPNVIPIPFINHLNEHQFLPPGIPINFIPQQDPKIIANYVLPNPPQVYNNTPNEVPKVAENVSEHKEETVEKNSQIRSEIDIAKIVSKLEEAAQQQIIETKKPYHKPTCRYNSTKSYSVQRTRYGTTKPRQENQQYYDNQKPTNPRMRFRKPEQAYHKIQKPRSIEVEKSSKIEPSNDTLRSQTLTETPKNQDQSIDREVTTTTHKEEKRIYKDVCTRRPQERGENRLKSQQNSISPKIDPNNKKSENTCARVTKQESTKVEIKAEPTTPKLTKARNQWISVSNRKKRKNKVMNEEENSICSENEDEISDDQFESFDVNLLQDVIPPAKELESAVETIVVQTTEAVLVPDVNPIVEVQCERTEELVNDESAKIASVKIAKKKKEGDFKNKTKKSGAGKVQTIKKVMVSDNLYLSSNAKVEVEVAPKVEVEEVEEVINTSNDKSVEITLDKEIPLVEELQKEVESVSVMSELIEIVDEPSEIPPSSGNLKTEDLNLDKSVPLQEEVVEPIEKKSKKKKKKQTKSPLIIQQSSSSSNATLNNLDDSYDFLLETSTLEDFDQKTNLEISQELDRMIQKGIYSTLEEKIKSLKLNSTDDGFFKTLNYDVLQNQISEKSNNIIKPNGFGKITTTQLLKMPTANKDDDKEKLIDIDFSKIKLPDLESQPSTSKSDIFIDVENISSKLQEMNSNFLSQESSNIDKTVITNGNKLKNKIKKGNQKTKTMDKRPPKAETEALHQINGKGENLIEIKTQNLNTPSKISRNQDANDSDHLLTNKSKETLYPITQAVKEWMTKTRENTPDVEILKSPNTIYKELNTIKEKTPPKKQEDKRERDDDEKRDDEITLWSVSPQESIEEDLLDCWENELTNGHNLRNEIDERCQKIVEIKGSVQNGCSTHTSAYIEEGEDVIEIYDSKYGANEDFLKIQAEIEQKQYTNDLLNNIPKHGNLPYRAICCTIM